MIHPPLEPGAIPAPLAPDVQPPTTAKETVKTPEQRVEAAERHKTQGNVHFQAGNLEAARKEYEEALKCIGQSSYNPATIGMDLTFIERERQAMIEEGGPEVVERSKACRIPTQLNLALCCLRSSPCEAQRALELCESILDEEPKNPKAIYRKAKALIELEIFDEAEWELTRAYKLLPNDANVRQDLQKLRRQKRETKELEKRTYEGVFQRGAGFASDGREAELATPAVSSDRSKGSGYVRMKAPEENPYSGAVNPAEDASRSLENGKLEEAIWAYEAAIDKFVDTNTRFEYWLELGRLYMDLNNDRLALLCMSKAVDSEEGDTRRHGLLLSSICLLNEAESDTEGEVCNALKAWLAVSRPGEACEGLSSDTLDAMLSKWRESDGGSIADVGVAHGLLHLVRGQPDAALEDFAAVLSVPENAAFFFGSPRRRSTKWNMLGAVLANRTRHEHALLAYDEALRSQPHYPRALMNQGISLQALSRHGQAAASFALVLGMVPSWSEPVAWGLLKKSAAQCLSTHPGLEEAADERNLAKVRELLRQEMSPVAPVPISDRELLKQLGFG